MIASIIYKHLYHHNLDNMALLDDKFKNKISFFYNFNN